MEEKNVLFKKQTTHYTTNIYKPFCTIIVEKPKEVDDIFGEYPVKVRQNNIHSKNGFFEHDGEYTDETKFVENYANPMASVNITRSTYVIEQKEKNISIKYYYYRRYRMVNKKYFTTRKILKYLTFNFTKKMFYAGDIQSKRKKVTNKRQFFDVKNLKDGTNGLYYTFANCLDGKNVDDVFNIFYNVICDKLNLNIDKNLPLDAKHFLIYLKNKKIKYPDTFSNFINFYFKLSDVRKCKNNLVNYVMDYIGIKGNNVRKILNTQLNINTENIKYFYELLGVDYFNKIKNTKIFSFNSLGVYNTFWEKQTLDLPTLTNSEKSNIVTLLEKCTYGEQLQTIIDHMDFKNKLKSHGEIVKIKAKNIDDFNIEHEEWSKLVASYKTGIIERYYGEKQNEIEKTIICDKDMFFPVLLKGTSDYEKESSLQRNCVRTYSQKPDCLIISLRKNSSDGDERLTIEYQFRRDEILNVQTRAKHNQLASEDWKRAIEILDNAVKKLYKEKVIELPKITKTYRNGRKIESNAEFPEEEKMVYLTPKWDNPIMYSENTNYLFDDLF